MTKKTIPEAAKKEFANRLKALMAEHGWNNSELARRAKMGRDNVSCYVRALTMPERPQLVKLAKALNITVDELAPGAGYTDDLNTEIPLEIRKTEDGLYYLRVGQRVTWAQASKIMEALNEQK